MVHLHLGGDDGAVVGVDHEMGRVPPDVVVSAAVMQLFKFDVGGAALATLNEGENKRRSYSHRRNRKGSSLWPPVFMLLVSWWK